MSGSHLLLSSDHQWIDHRLLDIFHTQYAYSAEPPSSIAECQERASFTRSQVRLAAGLDPMPAKLPLNPVFSEGVRFEGTVITQVRLEVLPGFFITGSLYAPERVKIQAPGILCAHGHSQDGRLQNDDTCSTPKLCMMMARLGFIVFSYDMLGYNDSHLVLHEWPEKMRHEYALNGLSPYGLQTWSSLCALDMLCSLEQVDERRIGVIGEGAGAAQAYTVALLDERVRVIAPIGMLSSHYQGECYCENGPLLRLNGITSFDILCACAPRPLLLPSMTQDATNLNPRYEVPALRKVYELFDAEDALRSFQMNAAHNFNKECRQRVYPWFTHWLLNQSLRTSLPEDDLPMPPVELLRLNSHADKPSEASTQHLLGHLSTYLCANALPGVSEIEDIAAFRQARRDLVSAIVNNEQNLKNISYRVMQERWSLPKGTAHGILVSRRDHGDVIPAVRVYPEKMDSCKAACLLLTEAGKKDFFAGGTMNTVLDMLLNNNCFCLAADILGTGETSQMPEKSYRQPSHPLFDAFNPSLFSMRVQDILTLMTMLHEDGFEKIILVANGNTLKPALAALAVTKPIFAAILNMEEQKDNTEDWLHPLNYQPMIQKAGGMTGLTALANARMLSLYKPSVELAEYVNAFSEKSHIPQHVTIGRESFIRMIEYTVCNLK